MDDIDKTNQPDGTTPAFAQAGGITEAFAAAQAEQNHDDDLAALRQNFDEYWSRYYQSRGGNEAAEAAERDAAWEREQAFFNKISEALDRAVVDHPDETVTALFDIDETTGWTRMEPNPDPEAGSRTITRTVLRPAFTQLARRAERMHAGKVEIGVLTSRYQDHIDEDGTDGVRNALATAGIPANQAFVLSSKDSQVAQMTELASSRDPERLRAAVGDLVDPAKITADLNGWYDHKLLVVARLAQAHPDRHFLLADDLPFIDAMTPGHSRVTGVRITRDEQFFRP